MRKNEECGLISWVSQATQNTLIDAVDCPEHNELFGLNRVNPNQQWMHLMNKIDKKINLEDLGDASIIQKLLEGSSSGN